MDINEFISYITEEFEGESQQITANTPFRSLDTWSSMQALIIIARIHEEYAVLLSEDDLQQSQTFVDLYERVLALK
ncbi:MAG TPA: acyl carrier protein [Saprospiraceae bacterium]|nr:acyl carrier protein [Saprospiraceae bacterium]